MAILVIVVLKGPPWVTQFIRGLLKSQSDQQRDQGERFIKAIGDLSASSQHEAELDRNAFERRNEILRVAIASQEAKFTAVLSEIQELSRQVRKSATASAAQARATKRVADRLTPPDPPPDFPPHPGPPAPH